MPIYFYPAALNFPIFLESIGNRWKQTPIMRSNGYPYYHWLQTESGQGEVIIENQKHILDAGNGVLIAPFVPHSYHALASGWITSFATFQGFMMHDIHKSIGRNKFCFCHDSEQFSFQKWTDRLVAGRDLDANSVSSDCYRFMLNFVQGSSAREMQHPLFLQYVLPAVNEIEQNFRQEMTAHMLAGKLFISPQYLNRLFQRFLNCSTYQYLLNVRLSHSKELLVSHPATTILDIAAESGFHDASHFCKSFKKHTGFTPIDFRRIFH